MTEPAAREAAPPASPSTVQVPLHTLDRTLALVDRAMGQWSAQLRAERSWRFVKRLGLTLIIGSSALIYLTWYARVFGFALPTPEMGQRVAVVTIAGPIGRDHPARADTLVPLIDRACRHPRTRAVVVRIASPGGDPSEAARVGDRIRSCREDHGRQVMAYIDGLGASGGYLVAINADEVLADRYAFVGSIGAVNAQWHAKDLLEGTLGVSEQVYATGALKYPASLATPPTPQARSYIQGLVDAVGERFLADVVDRRGAQLRGDPRELYTGEVWIAEQALQLGLIDAIEPFEAALQARWPGTPVRHYAPPKPSFPLLATAHAVGREAVRGAMSAADTAARPVEVH